MLIGRLSRRSGSAEIVRCCEHLGSGARPDTGGFGGRIVCGVSQAPTAPDQVPPGGRQVVSFVHRGGRMTDGQEAAWRDWWPVFGRDLATLEPGTPLDLAGWFGRRGPVILEIGSGMGESTAAMAAAAPDVDHLAVEVYQPGLARLLIRIRDQGLTNLRLLRGDAVRVLRDHLEPGSLAGIRVYFSDPWPKRRHHKRRLIQPGLVALAASRLVPGGTLHLATDWAQYAEQMREICDAEPLLRNTAPDGGWTPRPPWRPLTKFEQRALAEGREVRDLLYSRTDTRGQRTARG
jgi:tRNA (guanine-N7-)-methyltransferase